jgi:hypothetical protein
MLRATGEEKENKQAVVSLPAPTVRKSFNLVIWKKGLSL